MSDKKLSYDPAVKYEWTEKTEFSLSGNEFGLILNTFRTILSSPEAQKIIMLNTANDVIESILQKNVENGNVSPVNMPTEKPTLAPMRAIKQDKN